MVRDRTNHGPIRAQRDDPNGRALPGEGDTMPTKKHKKNHNPENRLHGRQARIARRLGRQAPPPDLDDVVGPELPTGAILEIVDWLFDHAVVAANGNTDDVRTVERVRLHVHDRIEGYPSRSPTESETLTTLALAVAAMEQRHGLTGLGELVAQSVALAEGRSARRGPSVTNHLYCVP